MGFFSEMGFIVGLGEKRNSDDMTSLVILDSDEIPSKNMKTDGSVTRDANGKTTTGDTIMYAISITNDGSNNIVNPLYSSTDKKRGQNPYIKLLEDFNDDNSKISPAKQLNASDFIYLRDIGVYPINKMFILKRFDSQTPSYDLNDHDHTGSNKATMGKSNSTVVGWLKDDKEIFSFSFNEVWKTQSKWLHELLREITQQQFGIDIGAIFPIPGWGQAMMFDLMYKMGMSSYDKNHMPMGDPNLLREGVLRETNGMGLQSSMSFKLETVYEIKYVNGIDPSIIYHNIIQNLMSMGTSNMNYLLKNSSTIRNVENLFTNPTVGNLFTLVTKFFSTVIKGITDTLKALKNDYELASKKAKGPDASSTQVSAINKENHKNAFIQEVGALDPSRGVVNGKITQGQNIYISEYLASGDDNKSKVPVTREQILAAKSRIKSQKKIDENKSTLSKLNESGIKKAKSIEDVVVKITEGSALIKMVQSQINGILKSTLSRYLWDIKGAINQATGANNTPWHLTIGNPYSPILSMNNIKVSNVEIKLGSELLYNDLPKFIYATISIDQARNLGKQEMLRMFGVKYKRDYATAYRKDITITPDMVNPSDEQIAKSASSAETK